MKTYATKQSEVTRSWRVVDADGVVLGRLATEVAAILRGKHKTIFSPHLDTGDPVIIVNAAKVRVTGNKLKAKNRSSLVQPHPDSAVIASVLQESLLRQLAITCALWT